MKSRASLVAGFAGDLDFVDFLVVEVAQRALDQRAFLVDEGRGLRLQRHVAHGFPHPDQIFEVALDLGLGARGAGGAQDDPHALGHVEILHHFLQPRTVLRRGDLAADAAAARGVGHQHGIAAGQRQIGGQRRALVAALFLDDLHQHHLAALDDFLDLVLAARAEGALRHFLQHVVAADGFDDFLFGVLAVVLIVVAVVAFGSAGHVRRRKPRRSLRRRARHAARRRHGRVFVRVFVVMMLVMRVFVMRVFVRRLGGGRLDRRHGGCVGFRFRDRGFACGICAFVGRLRIVIVVMIMIMR